MKTYAIGDIHGMFELFMDAMNWIEDDAGDDARKVICVGDYVDRGPDSRKVLEFIERSLSNPDNIFLRGNHDEMMHEAVIRREDNGWLRHPHYGVVTLEGYDVPGQMMYDRQAVYGHAQMIATLPTMYEDEHRLYVHAGFEPGLTPHETSVNSRLWVRPDTGDVPEHDFGKLVVHGHTPQPFRPKAMPFRLNIDTGACYIDAEEQVVGDEFGSYGRLTVARWDENQKLTLMCFVPGKPPVEHNVKLPRGSYYENNF